MALTFGPHNVEFRAAPLTKVVCQVKFSPIYALLSSGSLAGFQDAIRKHYPKAEEKRNAEVRVGNREVRVDEKVPIWTFSDDDGWMASVAIDFVSLETDRYLNFQEFIERLDLILDAARRTIQPTDTTRVGLRKINAIEHPDVKAPYDWADLIRPELVGLLGLNPSGGTVDGGAAEVRMQDADIGTLMVRHGLWLAPDGGADLSYHLDLDYWTDQPFRIRGGTDLSDLLQGYSDAITSFFTWSLLPKLYEYLGPGSRSTVPRSDGVP